MGRKIVKVRQPEFFDFTHLFGKMGIRNLEMSGSQSTSKNSLKINEIRRNKIFF
jgi:hypothetical protein